MSVKNKVVAHLSDGRLIKGTTPDFSSKDPAFHVEPLDGSAIVAVRFHELKAVFFVRELAGDSRRQDLQGFISAPPESVHGKKLAIRFADGELLCGYTMSYSARRTGFFVFPADPGSNNLRVYVIASPEAEVSEGAAAEQMVRKAINARAA